MNNRFYVLKYNTDLKQKGGWAYSWKPESLLSASPVRGWTRNPGFSQVPGGFERRFFVVKLCEHLEVTLVKFQAPEGSMNRGIIMFVVLRSWERRHVGGEAPERWNPGRLPALKKTQTPLKTTT